MARDEVLPEDEQIPMILKWSETSQKQEINEYDFQ